MSFEDTLRIIVRQEFRTVLEEFREELATPTSAPALLTAADIAARCKVVAKTVRAWIETGELPARKVARRWLVSPPDLERFLSASTPAAKESDDVAVARILKKRSS